MNTTWILVVYLLGYSPSAPLWVDEYPTLKACNYAGKQWLESRGDTSKVRPRNREYACIPAARARR